MPSSSGSERRAPHSGCRRRRSRHCARPEHGKRISRDRAVALAGDVGQPQLDRVDLEPSGQLVDQRFERECGGRRRGCAVGAERDAVGGDAVGGQLVRLPPVRPGGEHRGDRLQPEVVGRSAVAQRAGADPGEAAVGGGAELEVDHLRRRRVARGHVLAARQGQPHRPLQHQRGGGDERLEQHQLPAESAARAARRERVCGRRPSRTARPGRRGWRTAPESMR